jgi:hypothetical protein
MGVVKIKGLTLTPEYEYRIRIKPLAVENGHDHYHYTPVTSKQVPVPLVNGRYS